ncbi:DUF2642 domain-containing protein [Paenibacillus methanolicus]|uniref:DUF2642 domain-containing protein n=1 Tax=Paenibacillus methanolicus TaxID=582686 RepID=A0A5S5BS66_9BACL|nr:DUF2642 domain-containing protein [Paenibacillus methanolicus]TYP69774.1 hypothetical protein BCM02_113106 [Paenibacillus methanolicus]
MRNLRPLLNRYVELQIADAKQPVRGWLADLGQDILVVYTGSNYVYAPLVHVRRLKLLNAAPPPSGLPEAPYENMNDGISYRKILMNAKGMFSELYITGEQTVHGYVNSVMNDFFVFYSPVHHSVIVSLQHLKYLIPYSQGETPYALTPEQFPLKPSPLTYARSFDQQLQKLIGEFVILNLGEQASCIGVLKGIDQQIVELSDASGTPVFLHLNHIKTVHLP